MHIARDVETELRGSMGPGSGEISGTKMWKGSREYSSGYVYKNGSGSRSGQNLNSFKSVYGPGSSRGTQAKVSSLQSELRFLITQANRNSNSSDGEQRIFSGDRNRGTKHLPYSESSGVENAIIPYISVRKNNFACWCWETMKQ